MSNFADGVRKIMAEIFDLEEGDDYTQRPENGPRGYGYSGDHSDSSEETEND